MGNFDRRFQHKNEEFTCIACGQWVPSSSSTCRNHCPFCLTSVHVDTMPGDRKNTCKGLMRAVSYRVKGGLKELDLMFECTKCGAHSLNKALLKDKNQPDDMDQIIALGAK